MAATRLRELERLRAAARADAARADAARADAAHDDGLRPEASDRGSAAEADADARAALLEALESLDPGSSLTRGDEAGHDEAADGSSDLVDGTAMDGAQSAPAASRIGRRQVAIWIASLAATAVVASAVTWGIAEITPVRTSSGAPQIATLEPVAESGFAPEDYGGAVDSPVWEFHGLTFFRGSGWTENDSECLSAYVMVAEAEDSDGAYSGGWAYTGCGAGSFPAVATIPLDKASGTTTNLPDELRAAFPDATAIQFVLDGDRVGVFLDED